MDREDDFGKWMKLRRGQLDLTQQQLADCAGCSTVTIRKFEVGERRPSVQLAELLAGCLGIRADERELFVARARGLKPDEPSTRNTRLPGERRTLGFPQTTPFIGRDEELLLVTARLKDPNCRLLTLIGAGGMGKTRLALAAAQALIDDFAGGVVFAPLAAVTQAAHLPLAIAYSLGISLMGPDEPAVQLGRYLQDKELLLVLDNFEQLLDGAEVLAGWLAAAPGVKLLATSRERLNLVEEWVVPVQGFTFLSQGIELFILSARRVQPNFNPDGQESSIALICQLLGGMPLAIELAAGWTAVMICEQIAAHLQMGLDLLTTGLRNIPARHRDLRGLFDRSWQLLAPEESEALMKLSVFRGGFAPGEALAVAGTSLPRLLDLVQKSLLSASGLGRYDFHELAHRYAGERLAAGGQEAEARGKHLQTFLKLAETGGPRLYGPEAVYWFGRLEDEQDNFRAAMGWALEAGLPERALQLANSLWWFWFRRGHWREAERWTSAALEHAKPGDSPQRCRALLNLSTVAALKGRYGEAAPYLMSALEMARRIVDAESLAAALIVLGQAIPDASQAISTLDEAQAIWEQAGDRQKPWVLAHLHSLVGDRLREMGRYDEAAQRYERSLALYRQAGDIDSLAYPLGNLGWLALRAGRLVEAQAAIHESMSLSQAIGNRQGVADWLIGTGVVALNLNEAGKAKADLQKAAALHAEMGGWRGLAESQTWLALASLIEEDLAAADQYIRASLEAYRDSSFQNRAAAALVSPSVERIVPDFVDSLSVAGLVALGRGQAERAVSLLSSAERLRRQIGHLPDPLLRAKLDQAALALQARLSHSAHQTAWGAGKDSPLEEILDLALQGA